MGKKKTNKPIPNIQDLYKEIKEIKLDIKELKEKQKNDSDKEIDSNAENEQNLENIESVPNDLVFVLKQITTRKYLIKITLIFSKDFKIGTITLFDTGADLSCIKKHIIPR